jgi:hypothetical protein
VERVLGYLFDRISDPFLAARVVKPGGFFYLKVGTIAKGFQS